jgi:uncharacterized membrane protein YgcG
MRRVIVFLALLAVFAAPATVLARDIPRLASQITDETGELSGSTSRIQPALDALRRDHRVQLWVLFVETTDNLSITDFATQVAQRNSLGVNDALLVVALGDRTDSIWVADGLPQITNSEIDAIITDRVEPSLGSGDFAGAIVGAAEGLGDAAGGTTTPATPATPAATQDSGAGGGSGGQGGQQASGGGISIVPVVLVVVAVVIVYAVAVRVLRGRRGRTAAEERDRQTGDLAKEANRLLVETDDAVRSGRQELGFAEAQFSEDDVKPFREALDAASAELKAAFVIRQQLDDAVPEDPPTRARMLGEIVERCKRARALVDDQLARLQALRDLERTAPDILAQLPEKIAAVEARIPQSTATLDRLRAAYAPATWKPVDGNPVEADKRLQHATSEVERGKAAIAGGDPSAGASAARAAQDALVQAGGLLDAIDRLAGSLDDAASRLPAALTDAEQDLAAARAAIASGQVGPQPSAPLDEAQRILADARAVPAGQPPDVLAALAAAARAHEMIDRTLAGAREAQAQQAREAQALVSALQSATSAVAQASDYIEARRGGVGREARTRLAEAGRHLEDAQAAAATDAARAVAEAQQANRLAGEAMSYASSDFGRYDGGYRGGGGGIGGGGGGGGSDIAGAIIGGIIGGMLSGGGNRGGGFGGTHWGSSGGGGFGRSIGGSFGGGGGRARGGRW